MSEVTEDYRYGALTGWFQEWELPKTGARIEEALMLFKRGDKVEFYRHEHRYEGHIDNVGYKRYYDFIDGIDVYQPHYMVRAAMTSKHNAMPSSVHYVAPDDETLKLL